MRCGGQDIERESEKGKYVSVINVSTCIALFSFFPSTDVVLCGTS